MDKQTMRFCLFSMALTMLSRQTMSSLSFGDRLWLSSSLWLQDFAQLLTQNMN